MELSIINIVIYLNVNAYYGKHRSSRFELAMSIRRKDSGFLFLCCDYLVLFYQNNKLQTPHNLTLSIIINCIFHLMTDDLL